MSATEAGNQQHALLLSQRRREWILELFFGVNVLLTRTNINKATRERKENRQSQLKTLFDLFSHKSRSRRPNKFSKIIAEIKSS
jgi:hypothetical protein